MAERKDPLVVKLNGYCFRPTSLPPTLELSKANLVKHIKSVIEANERHYQRECTGFYIGKTYLPQRKRQSFNPGNPEGTCKMTGVSSRWKQWRKEGYDAMVVIAVITDKNYCAVNNLEKSKAKQEYALSLEVDLINHFRYTERRYRQLDNESTRPGSLERNHAVAYALYLAMKLKSQVAASDEQPTISLPATPPSTRGSSTSEHCDPSHPSAADHPADAAMPRPSTGCPALDTDVVNSHAPVVPRPLVTPTSAAQPSELATADAHFIGDLATPTTRLATPTTQPDTPPCVQPTSSTIRPATLLSPPATPAMGTAKKRCKCGSDSHQRSNSKHCPHNKKNIDPTQPRVTDILKHP